MGGMEILCGIIAPSMPMDWSLEIAFEFSRVHPTLIGLLMYM